MRAKIGSENNHQWSVPRGNAAKIRRNDPDLYFSISKIFRVHARAIVHGIGAFSLYQEVSSRSDHKSSTEISLIKHAMKYVHFCHLWAHAQIARRRSDTQSPIRIRTWLRRRYLFSLPRTTQSFPASKFSLSVFLKPRPFFQAYQ